MAVMAVWAAVLFTYGVSTGTAMDPAKNGAGSSSGSSSGANSYLQLDMAPNSVDDMYDGCKDDMANVAPQYLQNERNKDATFKTAWDSSVSLYDKKWTRPFRILNKEQVVAIYYYTFGAGNVYLDFNNAVRTQGPQYKTTFRYHALHFYLTGAIQALNDNRLSNLSPGEDRCITGYRRVDRYFNQVVNTQIRFGSFTSASMGQYSKKVERFGDKSCFKIYTCMGADVSMHSKFQNEGEVLIPPYEIFKITKIKKRSEQKDLPCEVEYKLQSTQTFRSDLNCALFKS